MLWVLPTITRWSLKLNPKKFSWAMVTLLDKLVKNVSRNFNVFFCQNSRKSYFLCHAWLMGLYIKTLFTFYLIACVRHITNRLRFFWAHFFLKNNFIFIKGCTVLTLLTTNILYFFIMRNWNIHRTLNFHPLTANSYFVTLVIHWLIINISQ